MMTDLADLFSVLGGISDAGEIRKHGDFTKRVVVSYSVSSKFQSNYFICAGQYQQDWKS